MKGVLVIILLVGLVNVRAWPTTPSRFERFLEKLKEILFTIYKMIARPLSHLDKPVREDQVNFYLFTSDNRNQPIKLNRNNLQMSVGNNASEVIFILHGWKSSSDEEWFKEMRNAFWSRYISAIIISVDWRGPASKSYAFAPLIIYDVGAVINNLIVNLYGYCGVPRENILLVGHSLGGQIAGVVGRMFQKATRQNFPRIIALDPAGPLFSMWPKSERLNKEDAEVVEVIHSNGGFLGFKRDCGTIDFFINGGSNQPGCWSTTPGTHIDVNAERDVSGFMDLIGQFVSLFSPGPGIKTWSEFIEDFLHRMKKLFKMISESFSCNHGRAHLYFIKALLYPSRYKARKCDTLWLARLPQWLKLLLGLQQPCQGEEVAMGNLTTTLTGVFSLETNRENSMPEMTEEFRITQESNYEVYNHFSPSSV